MFPPPIASAQGQTSHPCWIWPATIISVESRHRGGDLRQQRSATRESGQAPHAGSPAPARRHALLAADLCGYTGTQLQIAAAIQRLHRRPFVCGECAGRPSHHSAGRSAVRHSRSGGQRRPSAALPAQRSDGSRAAARGPRRPAGIVRRHGESMFSRGRAAPARAQLRRVGQRCSTTSVIDEERGVLSTGGTWPFFAGVVPPSSGAWPSSAVARSGCPVVPAARRRAATTRPPSYT